MKKPPSLHTVRRVLREQIESYEFSYTILAPHHPDYGKITDKDALRSIAALRRALELLPKEERA